MNVLFFAVHKQRNLWTCWIQTSEDCVWCTVKTSNFKLLIGVCYRSPSSTEENNAKMLKLLDRAVNACWGNRIKDYRASEALLSLTESWYWATSTTGTSTIQQPPGKTGMNTEAGKFFSEITGGNRKNTEGNRWHRNTWRTTCIIDYIFTCEDNACR